jgi:hypothetical protein
MTFVEERVRIQDQEGKMTWESTGILPQLKYRLLKSKARGRMKMSIYSSNYRESFSMNLLTFCLESIAGQQATRKALSVLLVFMWH